MQSSLGKSTGKEQHPLGQPAGEEAEPINSATDGELRIKLGSSAQFQTMKKLSAGGGLVAESLKPNLKMRLIFALFLFTFFCLHPEGVVINVWLD